MSRCLFFVQFWKSLSKLKPEFHNKIQVDLVHVGNPEIALVRESLEIYGKVFEEPET